MSKLRDAAHRLCMHYPAGYDGMAVAIGVSSGGMLRQKVLGHKGARLDIDELLAMQSACGCTELAAAFAADSGGVFIHLPAIDTVDHVALAGSLATLMMMAGKLASDYGMVVEDGVINVGERALLEHDAREISRASMEFTALAVAVFGDAEAQANRERLT